MPTHYQVRIGKRAQRKLEKMDKYQSHFVMSWIKKNLVNTSNPRQFGAGLVGDCSGEWRYRIGDYRLNTTEISFLILD